MVKLYLESKGFLVLTNYKAKVAKNRVLEADIVAIRLSKNRDDKLPNRIIGEVKTRKIDANHFKELYSRLKLKSREEYKRFKILNNPKFKKVFLLDVENKYGAGFQFCIFALDIVNKRMKLIKEFLERERIFFVPYRDVIDGIIKYAESKTYSNDPELQLIRLMKRIGILKVSSSD